MKNIELTHGLFAQVDDSDFEYLNRWKWKALKALNTWYAIRHQSISGRQYTIYMHRFILNAGKDYQVDHVDHNGLNNQRNNIRLATELQNKSNQISRKGSTSKYVGVYFDSNRKKWMSRIHINGRNIFLGRHNTEEKAGVAYDEAAKIYRGEFAGLNFKEPLITSKI